MNVLKALNFNSLLGGSIEVSGYITIFRDVLVIVDLDPLTESTPENKIIIDDQDRKYILRDVLLPLCGKSFVFHRVRAYGEVHKNNDITLKVNKLFVEEKGDVQWLEINLDKSYMEKCKAKYKPTLDFNYFKEIKDQDIGDGGNIF